VEEEEEEEEEERQSIDGSTDSMAMAMEKNKKSLEYKLGIKTRKKLDFSLGEQTIPNSW